MPKLEYNEKAETELKLLAAAETPMTWRSLQYKTIPQH